MGTTSPEFDFDKLASKINESFQDEYKLFADNTARLLKKKDEELDKILNEKKKAVRALLSDIKGDLIAEMQNSSRTTLVLPNSQEIRVGHMAHPKTEDVVSSLQINRKAMLVGPAGTGKTYMINSIAKSMNLPFYKYSCSRDSSVHDLIGYKQPKSEEYLETVFLKAYEQGGIFLVDEYDAMSGDMSLFFNGVTDSSDFISIPHRDSNPIAKRHKDFLIVMCGNTWGKGSTDYSGRDFQDMALIDRFRMCRHFIDYHHQLEKTLLNKENYSIAIKLRAALEKIGSYLSTRNIEDMSNLINSGVNIEKIVFMLINDLSDKEKETIYNMVFNNAPAVLDTGGHITKPDIETLLRNSQEHYVWATSQRP